MRLPQRAAIVFNLTRFARDTYDHFALRSHLKSLGISLRSETEPIDDINGETDGRRPRRFRAVRQRCPFGQNTRPNAGSITSRSMDIPRAARLLERTARDVPKLDAGSRTSSDRSTHLQAVRDRHVYETGNSGEGDAVGIDQSAGQPLSSQAIGTLAEIACISASSPSRSLAFAIRQHDDSIR